MPGKKLKEYQRKRDFRRTPEPRGTAAPSGEGRLFVIQKHAARRLHYDFRLEMDGVLKSWAVPKGPSLNPGEKRLAVEVEDHPLEYGGFEGTIPKGEYGGGTVLLWDRGEWYCEGDALESYRKGNLKFRLEGKKLRGNWALVRMGGAETGGDRKNWLLIKKNDRHARPASREIVERMQKSVASGRTLEEIARSPGRVWRSAAGEEEDRRRDARKALAEPATADSPPAEESPKGAALSPRRIPGARRRAIPKRVLPQLATLVETAPEGDAWLHEIKYDGYRAICRIDRGKVRFFTRKGLDWTDRFSALASAARRLRARQAILDGEVVALQPDGTTSFQALQNAVASGKSAGLIYYVFDLLHLDGYDLTGVPLEARKEVLASLLPPKGWGLIRYSDHVVGRGEEFRRQACRFALEGIVSKRRDRPYRSGRGRDWLKAKCLERQEFVVGGYTRPAGSREKLGSLLLGVREPGKGLVYVGKVGTGFTRQSLAELGRRLAPIETVDPPFADPPSGSRREIHWVKPQLVAEVAYTDRTRDGLLRHPSFQGLREDKGPEEVVLETRGSVKVSRKGRRGGVRLTHPDRVLFPDRGITKEGLARYYQEVADWMLPHLEGRPLSLVRCPDGQGKPCFFQRHGNDDLPTGVQPVSIPELKPGKTYLSVKSVEGLAGLVQLGTLEIHITGSRSDRFNFPDRLVFDLDPDPALPWKAVAEAALLARLRLEDLGLESFVKTTGGKGLHVVVPILRKHAWDEVKKFCRALAEDLARTDPSRYTTVVAKDQRPGRIYFDYLRNVRAASSVAPYSTRARPGAPVSAPLRWDELLAVSGSAHYTVENLPRRLASLRRDPWEKLWSVRQSITGKMLKKLTANS